MDITGDRERETASASAAHHRQQPVSRTLTRDELDRAIITYTRRPHPDDVMQFTLEQAARIEEADEFMGAAMRQLETISAGENQYGVPPDIEKVALMNAIAGLLVEKGVCTMGELFVAKREALAEQVGTVAAQATRHSEQQARAKSGLIVAGPSDMPPSPQQRG